MNLERLKAAFLKNYHGLCCVQGCAEPVSVEGRDSFCTKHVPTRAEIDQALKAMESWTEPR